jgi:hypothetical protein
MYRIYKGVLSPATVAAINAAVDTASDGDAFELLIPPVTTEVLKDAKREVLAECPNIVWRDDAFVVTRSVTMKGNRASQCWHFDNFKTTSLIVLKSTDGIDNGDLMIRPYLRAEPRSLFWYMVTKVFWTNPLVWLLLRIPALRDRFFIRISLSAGDVMVFDGGTTYHGNLPVSSGMRRSILVHNEPYFKDALFTKFFHAMNKAYLYKKQAA